MVICASGTVGENSRPYPTEKKDENSLAVCTRGEKMSFGEHIAISA